MRKMDKPIGHAKRRPGRILWAWTGPNDFGKGAQMTFKASLVPRCLAALLAGLPASAAAAPSTARYVMPLSLTYSQCFDAARKAVLAAGLKIVTARKGEVFARNDDVESVTICLTHGANPKWTRLVLFAASTSKFGAARVKFSIHDTFTEREGRSR